MKRFIVFMLCICVVIPSLWLTSYAEILQGEAGENITEELQEGDSITMSDSEKEKIVPLLQKYYEALVYESGDVVKASVYAEYDIRQIMDVTGYVKIYYGYDPRSDLMSGVSITESVKKVTEHFYFKPVSDEKMFFFSYYDNKTPEYLTNVHDGTIFTNTLEQLFYEDILNLEEKFSIAEATKSIEGITVLQVYAFVVPHQRSTVYETAFIYVVTNKGDFVFYRLNGPYSNLYLIPADLFISITEKIFERQSFYDGVYIQDQDRLEGFVDLMPYSVSEKNVDINQRLSDRLEELHEKYPFFKGDPDFMGYASQYHFAKGIGVDTARQLCDLLMQIDPGYEYAFSNGWSREEGDLSWSDFLQMLTDKGCTTYAECRTVIDELIEEKKNPPPVTSTPSDGEETTQNTPAQSEGGKSYRFLVWLIPSVLAVLATAVIIFILIRKKKA